MNNTGLTIEEAILKTARSLEQGSVTFGHGTECAEDEAAWLVLHVAGLLDAPFEEIARNAVDEALHLEIEGVVVERISSRKPLAYLFQEAWFAGIPFYIDERAIIPRSHIGEWLSEGFEPWIIPDRVDSILDLCTGGGSIAVASALAFPGANVDAIDLSAEALEVAKINRQRYQLEQRLRLFEGDLFAPVDGHRYDLILCNPPYVSDSIMAELPLEYRHEPPLAFSGGSLGLTLIDRLLREAREHLTPEGTLIIEAGSASEAVNQHYPDLPFIWLTSANGESVVFMLTAAELEGLSSAPSHS
ncbi:MAG TPA: 50S ribosomal protein L3 N(5)-glutamine methyltransferase [Arenicellales bacterium]|jgi:ribosomal protein L3 glutamine methyltransferase|nr:50S ribosomal protein L3 N(5)-glutamine methyltransferase [Arenicellales bacterium]MDP7155914.1 50S ribosomal protein L3 N(5)-glutamine methyltransferase [Arenicellales bacterium]MDP7284082.1 50S ribosomal protein L3 N(5)-glutamine methyltransferase [Arenicellales bacterium]HJL65842.1 50S ribosomal protein L3 N(5)-glutamine methyltransferase [Arenicellales bacterium]HJP25910.1 50S ribosomal protein L3 N(5)-glutamine methyltransferase [Arenicellales bacterium]|tara:strand:+ start:6767 stop:7672 length:906 start_codon:yes stop_codon:yes gene_type:complete